MIPWIQVYSNLPQHPKTTKLADELGLSGAALNPNVIAVGIVVSLWTWAVQNAYDGDLAKCSDRAIADACTWRKKPETLVKALMTSGFLDEDRRLHDWDEYAGLLIDRNESRKENTRKRVAKCRAKKAVTNDECNALQSVTCNAECNVTSNECNAPTIPDHTIPNQVNPVSNDSRINSGAAAVYLDRVNASASQTCLEQLAAYEREMGTEVCIRAMDIALDNSKATWPYIRAILGKWQSLGVKCLADIDRLDVKPQQTGPAAKGKTVYCGDYTQGPAADQLKKDMDWLEDFMGGKA